MAVPDYQSLMVHVLRAAADGEVQIGDVVEKLASQLGLTAEDRAELLPSGKQTTFSNRVHWAKTYLQQAGLLESTRRAHFVITDRGRQALSNAPTWIDTSYLAKFPEFIAFRTRRSPEEEPLPSTLPTLLKSDTKTPDEVMRTAYQEVESKLRQDLLDRIVASPPAFFEHLIVSLLVKMGYGGTEEEAVKAIGGSGDDGVDGVIDQDVLGLDRVYIQAKRYSPGNNVGSSAIRNFFGSLDRFKASKGLFVTTSSFSKEARETVGHLSKRIVLVDGNDLTKLMVRYDVGCRIEETLHLRKVDEDFFSE